MKREAANSKLPPLLRSTSETLLTRLESMEFSLNLMERITWAAIVFYLAFLAMLLVLRGSLEFWGMLLGGGLSLTNFWLLRTFVARMLKMAESRSAGAYAESLGRTSAVLFLKLALALGGIVAMVLWVPMSFPWFIIGLSLPIMAIGWEIAKTMTLALFRSRE